MKQTAGASVSVARPARDILRICGPRRTRRLRAHRPLGVAVLAVALLFPGAVISKELLAGTIPDGEGGAIAFRLDGESREKVVGGRILLGDAEYTIARVSRLGLIGAHRLGGGGDTGEETPCGVPGVLLVLQRAERDR